MDRRRGRSTVPILCLAVILIPFLRSSSALASDGWHHPLYVSGGDYWRHRVRVEVTNQSARDIAGERLELQIGSGPGQVSLVGAESRSIRVVSDSGTEQLFLLSGSAGDSIQTGTIPEGSAITIPVECLPFGSAVYWIYFDNPSAWQVPDFLRPSGLLNGGVEDGTGSTPQWWRHDAGDPDHRASWVDESPYAGSKCLKLEVTPGAPNSWISTRQSQIPVAGGQTYTLSGWVRAENVSGGASTGWYVHVATPDNPLAINRGISAGGGTYGWRQVSWSFTAPAGAVSASVGTMLWGSGTAWFDEVTLDAVGSATPSDLQVVTFFPEGLELSELGADPPWFDSDPGDDIHWDFRVPLLLPNTGDTAREVTASVSLRRYVPRWRELNPGSFRIVDGTTALPVLSSGDELLFEAWLPARTRRHYYLYFSLDPRLTSDAGGMEGLVDSPRNRVTNPSFELGTGSQPSGWVFQAPADASGYGRVQPGLVEDYRATFNVPHGTAVGWPGWRQDVPVEPGRSYWFSGWVKLEDVRGAVRMHAHLRDANGNLVGSNPYLSIGGGLTGTTDWTQLSGTFTIPEGATVFQIHLTMNATGTLSHDGILLLEDVSFPVQGPVEPRVTAQDIRIWSVPAVIKVFEDDHPPEEISVPKISAAGSDVESLQLVVRSPVEYQEVQVEVEAPRHPLGFSLDEYEVGIVGFVPVAHTSDYYGGWEGKSWERQIVTGRPSQEGVLPSDFGEGSDGWAGWWPDPLLPSTEFSLGADRTQPVWVTFRVPPGTVGGDYRGKVRFSRGETTLAETPFVLHVWDFDLPKERRSTAIYDLRTRGLQEIPGQEPEVTREKLLRLMADYGVHPDRVLPEPLFSLAGGTVVADYTKFDEAAAFLIDTLGVPRVYAPSIFYLFGWANPPAARFGEAPYPGQYPYPGADRSQLRPEYKQVYQKVLAHFWEHLRQKGWDDRFVLYISDEPHYWEEGILEQFQALCNMIHEADPDVPIYSSVWNHIPEWDGYLDVWGIGHYGVVPPEKIAELVARGDRVWFTTDGHMCIDTPYLAIERLLPTIAFFYDVEGYEFWGVDWLTHDPYLFGWHASVELTFNPEDPTWTTIYPNGDGYLVYPGAPVGQDRAVPTIRLAQAREGQEDYAFLDLITRRIGEAQAAGLDVSEAEEALYTMARLVHIPSASGRWSTSLLPSPEALEAARSRVGRAIEELEHRLRSRPQFLFRGWDHRRRP